VLKPILKTSIEAYLLVMQEMASEEIVDQFNHFMNNFKNHVPKFAIFTVRQLMENYNKFITVE
jgi:D-lyxose ketol-isomerase